MVCENNKPCWLWVETFSPDKFANDGEGYVCVRPEQTFVCLPDLFGQRRELVCRIPFAKLRGWREHLSGISLVCTHSDGTRVLRKFQTRVHLRRAILQTIARLYWQHHLGQRSRVTTFVDVNSNDTCIICLDKMQVESEDLVTLTCCNISMHRSCISQWFDKFTHRLVPFTCDVDSHSPTCPACRSL